MSHDERNQQTRTAGAGLSDQLDATIANNISLRDQLDNLHRSEAAKYRRVDCLRIAQKHLEGSRNIGDSLLGTAANLAHFVENGDTGEPAKQPAA